MTGLRARTALFLRWTADRLSGEDPVAQLTQQVTALSTASGDRLLAAMYADPQHPLRAAIDADLRARSVALTQDSKDRWNQLMTSRDRHPSTSGSSWFGPSHPCRCAFPDDPDHLPPGGTW